MPTFQKSIQFRLFKALFESVFCFNLFGLFGSLSQWFSFISKWMSGERMDNIQSSKVPIFCLHCHQIGSWNLIIRNIDTSPRVLFGWKMLVVFQASNQGVSCTISPECFCIRRWFRANQTKWKSIKLWDKLYLDWNLSTLVLPNGDFSEIRN